MFQVSVPRHMAKGALPVYQSHAGELRLGVQHPNAGDSSHLPKEDTPFYKTYPFVGANIGLGAGMLAGVVHHATRFQQFVTDPARGMPVRHTLSIKPSFENAVGLVANMSVTPNENATSPDRPFKENDLKDSGRYSKQSPDSETHYVVETPLYVQSDSGKSAIDLRYQREEVNHGKQVNRLIVMGPDSPLMRWEAYPDAKDPRIQHIVLETRSPIAVITGATPKHSISLMKDESGKVHLETLTNSYVPLETTDQHIVQNSAVEALNGVQIWYASGLKDPNTFAHNPESYIQALTQNTVEHNASRVGDMLKWGVVLGAVGYGAGWIVEWFSRKKRNEVHSSKLRLSNTALTSPPIKNVNDDK